MPSQRGLLMARLYMFCLPLWSVLNTCTWPTGIGRVVAFVCNSALAQAAGWLLFLLAAVRRVAALLLADVFV
jgi:hypothetical protein